MKTRGEVEAAICEGITRSYLPPLRLRAFA
jgi:hypothetical protein